MRVHRSPASTPIRTTPTPTKNAPASFAPDAPLQSATPSALTATTTTTNADARVKAPWTARSIEIANAALAAAHDAMATGDFDAALTTVFDSILSQPALAKAKVSATFARDGHVIGSCGVDDAVNPCSNSKLVTAAFALSVLGPDHRFSTSIDQAKDGAIVFRGGFDPTLTTDDLVAIARELKAHGVTAAPRIVLDESKLVGSDVPAAFSNYGDEDWEYVARPNPLSVNKNALHLVVKPGPKLGAPAVVDVDQTAFSVRNRVLTSAVKQPFRIGVDELDTAGVLERDKDGKAIIDVWGTVAGDYDKGKQLVMKSPSPEESFADRVRFAFDVAGIQLGGVEVAHDAHSIGETAPLLVHESAPLADVLKTSLATSNAFDHEMFALAATSFAHHDAPVSLDDAAHALIAFLRARGARGSMVNASGIGNENKLRSADIVALLDDARRDPKLGALVDALATPGDTGTLKTRMLDTDAEGMFRGKTGTGDDAAALSGIAGGVTFSVLVDDSKGREAVRTALDATAIAVSTIAKRAGEKR